ncbi:hypothetical protein NDU88_002951 [Pleurodeles waltl]|uniref:Uncharacterized protein n=1 Tax=Pleurodeles waltl TaxID=8319 RepID=A0AAV7UX34_PLEWA|nr:hypothetical protein NDU88_002951 [Pleurodeles waltl]
MGRVRRSLGQARVYWLVGDRSAMLGRHSLTGRPPRSLLAISGSSHLSLGSCAAASASSLDPLARTRVLSSFQLHLRPGCWGHVVRLLAWPRSPS